MPTSFAILVFLIAGEWNGLYRVSRRNRWAETRALVFSWALVPATLGVLAFSTKTSAEYSRVVSFGWFLIAPLALFVGRAFVRVLVARFHHQGWHVQRVAVAGSNNNVSALVSDLLADPWEGVKVVGVYDDRRNPQRRGIPGKHATRQEDYAIAREGKATPAALSVAAAAPDHDPEIAGSFADMMRACRAGEIDVVYMNLPLSAQRRTEHLLRSLADTTVTVFLIADFFTYDLMCARWNVVGRYPVVSVYDTPFRGRAAVWKRIEDVLVGTAIVSLISIPMLLIALAIKLTSRGPVFFRQRRYGLNGKEIRVLKFRTMTVCEDGPQITQARRDDPRITRLGKFLRQASLDELPQFLQVLTGEMSIVGPRPHAVAHNEEYRRLIQGYMLRHKVKPGITGWAQVNGWRGETPEIDMMAKRIEHDLDYIKNWSLLLDLKIIFLTVFGKRKNLNAF